MCRLLPLLVLAPFVATAAAPVPPGAHVPFGTNGLLSRADLEKIAFDTQPALDRDGKPRDDDEEQDERKRGDKNDAKRDPKFAGPLRANRYDIAVHLPWAKFAAGERMPVYLVLRNNRDTTLGLHSNIDLSGTFPEMRGGGISFDVRARASGESMLGGLAASTNCGGGSLVDVPPFGFYCVAGDLNRLCGGLKPGEYEVDWRCGRFRSAPVSFSVLPSDPKTVAPAKPSHVHFYHLTAGSGGERFRWPDARLERVYTDSMIAALAVGQGGAYVPDVRAIPSADRKVAVEARWKPYRDGDRVAVTLRASVPGTTAHFREMPYLFLQVETAAENREWWDEPREAMKDMQADGRRELVTPLTIEARLPGGWRERLGPSERARVSVLVASKEVEFPRGARVFAEKLKDEVECVADGRRASAWTGVLRTEVVELTLPPKMK